MFSIRHKSAVRLVHVSTHPPPHIYIPMSGNLLSLWYRYMYQCTYSMFYEYDILPLICFEIMYILLINIIWLQMLLCMPESFVCDYRPLVSEPKLMLEQLLMNMKVWVPAVQKTYMVCLFFLFSLFKQIRVGIYQWQPRLFFFKSTKID